MPSILPGFEYDVFVSYRHNDNRSGWVSHFIRSLEQELASTIKEPISIYYDENSYDGLLETHHVDKSLENKIKCLIFIPILSQTYCDTKSYAWRYEFCAFNATSQKDSLGREIRLGNGNVASRILPVKIHDLEHDDLTLLEAELGGTLRSVEFIYKEPGVNRPLITSDARRDNQNNTDYRNQLNKLANAIKEIIYGVKKGEVTPYRGKILPDSDQLEAKPSLAVLPFANIGGDPEKEYLSDGITENIISELASNKRLRIISRTSVMRYKKTDESISSIASALNVKYILEGGVQISGKKVRINAQLVEAQEDDLIWSKVFVETLDDIFAIQNTVANVVATELKASFTDAPPTTNQVPTQNKEAYDLFLKGRHAFNQWNVEGYKTATDYFQRAIALDPGFKQAYSFLASSYSARMSWNGDLSPHEALPEIEKYLAEAWKLGPTDNDYLTKAFIEFFVRKDFKESEKYFLQAIDAVPNNASAIYTYSYLLNMMGRFDEAQQCVDAARNIEPHTVAYFNYQSVCHYIVGNYDAALNTVKEGIRLFPGVLRFYDFMARIHVAQADWEKAERFVEDGFKSFGIRPPSMVALLAMARLGMGKMDDGEKLLQELIARSTASEKGVNIYVVYVESFRKNFVAATEWLDKARATNDVDLIWWNVSPMLREFREYQQEKKKPDFEAAEAHILQLLGKEMPRLPYHNLDHIRDVLDASLRIAKDENVGDDDLKLLRLSALYHDAGFIKSAKDHEAHGAAMARKFLPNFGISDSQISKIESMILATKLPQSPNNKLEYILCDSDLDYLGREDFYERGKTLYEEMKAQGVMDTEREWNLVQKTFLESHRYHTNYSKTNRESAKQERLQEIIVKLKNRS